MKEKNVQGRKRSMYERYGMRLAICYTVAPRNAESYLKFCKTTRKWSYMSLEIIKGKLVST